MDLGRLNVRDFYDGALAEAPDAPFLVWAPDGSEYSYAAAQDKINRAADVWHSLGVRKGDRVVFMLDNSPAFVFAWLGLAKAGGVLVAVNTGFRAAEAGYLVANSGAATGLVAPEYAAVFEQVQREVPGLRQVLATGEGTGWESFAAAMDAAGPHPPSVDVRGDDLISLIYTSGTTGWPKGAMQTHRNFVLTGQSYGHWMRMRPGERVYACLPLFHINSQAYSTMGAIGIRGTMVLAPRFSASQFWPHVRRYRVNAFNIIGAMTVILSKSQPAPEDRDHQVHTAYGVPALPDELRQAVEERFGMTLVSGFGMSETTFGLMEPFGQPRRPLSMGLPRHHPDPGVPRTQARIVDENGQEVAPGVAGELILRTPATMAGYWADPERTAAALRDGWLYTGDSAYRDGDGFFYFVDRKKDIVRRRGENVSSLEVERVLAAHPGIVEAAVVGAPSEFTDEEIVAYVVRAAAGEPSAADLQHWCAARLAGFKVPARVEFVAELPKTATAKVRKSALRELAAHGAGRDAGPGTSRADRLAASGK